MEWSCLLLVVVGDEADELLVLCEELAYDVIGCAYAAVVT